MHSLPHFLGFATKALTSEVSDAMIVSSKSLKTHIFSRKIGYVECH